MIWMEDLLLRDLLLLENQLPFFVLQRIFYLATGGEAISSSLVEVAINFFNKMFFTKRTGLPREPIHHLLHLYHWFLLSMPLLFRIHCPFSQSISENQTKLYETFGWLWCPSKLKAQTLNSGDNCNKKRRNYKDDP